MFRNKKAKKREREKTEYRDKEELEEIKLQNAIEDMEYELRPPRILGLLKGAVVFVVIGSFIAAVYSNIQTSYNPHKAENMLKEFEKEYAAEKNTDREAMQFAENFAQQYLFYETDGEEDFKQRIKKYVSNKVQNTEKLYSFTTDSYVNSLRAYRTESLGNNQLNVYVEAETLEVYKQLATDEEVAAQKAQKDQEMSRDYYQTYTLKIPIRKMKEGYIVEDVPVLISDATYYYNQDELKENAVTLEKVELDDIVDSITNFLKAYYSEEQTVVDYYLHSQADKQKFNTLAGGTMVFKEMKELNTFADRNGDILCILQVQLENKVTKNTMLQEFQLTVSADVQSGSSKYLIKDIDTKTINIQEEKKNDN